MRDLNKESEPSIGERTLISAADYKRKFIVSNYVIDNRRALLIINNAVYIPAGPEKTSWDMRQSERQISSSQTLLIYRLIASVFMMINDSRADT